jgi:hypothetical protein
MSGIKKYYLRGLFQANYSGYLEEDSTGSRTVNYEIRDILNSEVSDLSIIPEYNNKELIVGDKYLHFENLYGIVAKHGNLYYRINVSDAFITNIYLSEYGKDGRYSFGKLKGLLTATIEKPLEETVLPSVLTYKDSAEVKQVSFINNTSGTLTPIDQETGKPVDSSIPDLKANTTWSPGDIFGIIIGVGLLALLFTKLWMPLMICVLIIAGIWILTFLGNLLGRLLGFVIGALLLIGLLSWLMGQASKVSSGQKPQMQEDQIKETSEIRKDTTRTAGDSLLIAHHRVWNDYGGTTYETDLIISQHDYLDSKLFHENISASGYNSDNAFWKHTYSEMARHDEASLHFLYEKFDSILRINTLNKVQFAKMVVSCVQDIPYTMVVNLECGRYKQENPMDAPIIERTGCFGPVKYGVQSPAEFIYNLKGDCDTRTTLCFAILSHYLYDVAILSSSKYRHSILGVDIPINGTYKNYDGKSYMLWETTAKACPPGYLPPDFGNLDYWEFTLLSNQ